MYRITAAKSWFGDFWLIATEFLAVAVLASFAAWVHKTVPPQQGGWLVSLGLLATYGSIAGAIAFIASVAKRLYNYANGREIIFSDQLTIHYPWPVATRIYEWNEIEGIQIVDEQHVVQELESWTPIPIVTPDVMTDFMTLAKNVKMMFGPINSGEIRVDGRLAPKERIKSTRTFRILHSNGNCLSNFSGDNFRVVRWLGRKTLYDLVKSAGGEIIWNNDLPQRLSLCGSSISVSAWEFLKEQFVDIPGLTEIDLTNSSLGDEALIGLDQFPSLLNVQTNGSRISSQAHARLDATLAKRRSQGEFAFLVA